MPATDSVLGLDIGHHSAKAVRAVMRHSRMEITHADTLRLPPDVTDPAQVIAPWLNSLGFQKLRTVVGVQGSSVMFQPFSLPPEDPRSMSQAVTVEIARYNEVASESMVYDFLPLAENEDGKALLLAMARPNVLDKVLDLPKRMGLTVIDLIPMSVAVVNALHASIGPMESPCVFVDVGHTVSEVLVANKEGILFARSFMSGGAMFTDAVAAATDQPSRHAEETKVTQGSMDGGDKVVSQALHEAADQWLAELETCLSVYSTSYQADRYRPTRMVVSGGASELKGFTQYVRGRLGIDVVAASSLKTLPPFKEAGRYAVAVGLAMSAFGLDFGRLSLLPPVMKERLFLKRQKKHWIIALTTAALILAISVGGGYRDLKRQQERLSKQQGILGRCQRLADEISAVEKKNRQVVTMAQPAETLVRNGPFVRDLLQLLAVARSPDDWITMVCDADSYLAGSDLARGLTTDSTPAPVERQRRRQPIVQTKEGNPEVMRSIIVEGYTKNPDLSSVNELIGALRASSFIDHADLLSDDRVVLDPSRDEQWAERRAYRFVLEIKQAAPQGF
jgi:Tfp pilus assembly PilM family ATPase